MIDDDRKRLESLGESIRSGIVGAALDRGQNLTINIFICAPSGGGAKVVINTDGDPKVREDDWR